MGARLPWPSLPDPGWPSWGLLGKGGGSSGQDAPRAICEVSAGLEAWRGAQQGGPEERDSVLGLGS